ncbi:D-alanyl-D-alanine carboxypeptidase family protein [Phenylobacterium sp.]|uniref:D-alanyl-D-alanine carboxypeptidase family protein n=1 Tax=Phenylobacterium sp. TaxID=1871053 RepID=UPI002BD54778|nr:D-alanyl-D-alanine carboxypeptidase family protein [Phenylobacterium sp.]HVI30757.1 D-alanyl-D-alanine carboxypeptidase family protein [Phenylobacterium sp.]
MFQHARRLFVALGAAAAVAFTTAAPPAYAQPAFKQLATASQTKYAAIVVDAKTGEVLYAKRADAPRYPASITKVMTLYLTFEALAAGKIRLDDPVLISPRAAAQSPTKLGVPAGQTITVSEAMQALAIKSANDVAVAMAEKLGGTESRFAALMTLRAKELGMTNTNFANASGLPDSRQISTARDIAILSRAVMRDYPQYYRLFSQKEMTFRGQTMRNHNGLLHRMYGVDGLKTGFTNASGFNLAVSAVRDNRRLIAVVLGGPTTRARDENAQDLLLTGFDVIRRRDLGEKITIAQNLFEPEPTGRVEGSLEQGDQDLKIVLASAAPPSRTSKIEVVEPRSKKKAEAPAGEWAVQVGAFKARSDAKEQIDIIEKRFGKQVAGAKPVTDKAAGRYRSRFVGLSEAKAKNACKAIKAKKQPCQVIEPNA